MATQSRATKAALAGEVLDLQQFLCLPEIKPALEFLGGRVMQKVSPTVPHSLLGFRLAKRLDEHASATKSGLVLPDLRCSFGGESLVPDICVFARGRLPRDQKGSYVERVSLAPDLAVEILSPGQTLTQMKAKLARCVANGVRLAWLIQPRTRRVFVFRPGLPPQELGPGAVLDGHEILPGLTLPLDELFGWLVAED